MGDKELLAPAGPQGTALPLELRLPLQHQEHLEPAVDTEGAPMGLPAQLHLIHIEAGGLLRRDQPLPPGLFRPGGGAEPVPGQQLLPGQAVKMEAVQQAVHAGGAIHALHRQAGTVRADVLRPQGDVHRLLQLGHQGIAPHGVGRARRDEVHLPRTDGDLVQAVQQGRRVLPLDQPPEIRRRDAGPEPQPDARPRTGVQHVPRLILPGGQAEILPRPRPVRMGLEQQAVPGVEQLEQKAQAGPPARGVSLPQPGRRVFRQAVPQ